MALDKVCRTRRSAAITLLPYLVCCVTLFSITVRTLQSQAVRLTARKVGPRLNLLDWVTVSANPSAVTFALSPGMTASGSAPIAVTTSWGGIDLLGSLTLYGYFASSSSALSGGSPVAYIPSSAVSGQVPTGTPTIYTPFTQTTPFSGASGLQLFSYNTILSLFASRTDNLSLKINLAGIPQLPAATYNGVLTFQAQAF